MRNIQTDGGAGPQRPAGCQTLRGLTLASSAKLTLPFLPRVDRQAENQVR